MPKTGCFVTPKSNTVFAAQKRRLHPKRDHSTVIIMVDRIALGMQIHCDTTGNFGGQDRNDLARRAANMAVLVKTRSAFAPWRNTGSRIFRQRLSRMSPRRG